MASSRHARRKAAALRLALKASRIARASHGAETQGRKALVAANLQAPQSRNRILPATVALDVRFMAASHSGFTGQGAGRAYAPKVIRRRWNVGHIGPATGAAIPQPSRDFLRHGGRAVALELVALAAGTTAER